MSFEKAHNVLSSSTVTVLREVPVGRKHNCHFVVDNSTNVNRNNRPNRFWGDCGVWDSR